MDGTPLAWTMWAPSNPTNLPYVVMDPHNTFKWVDKVSTESYCFVCQLEGMLTDIHCDMFGVLCEHNVGHKLLI